jgi:hypothetical protein
MKPYRLIPEGRGDNARQHGRALFRLEQYRVGDPAPQIATLPVAALPVREGESYAVQRGKVRPVLIVSTGGTTIPAKVRVGQQRWQSSPTLLVAPYYGVDAGPSRAGWNAEFVARIRHAEYPQYVCDQLPIGGSTVESILRLDHLFPIGGDSATFRVLQHRLSADALYILDSWIQWLITDRLDPESVLALIREELMKLS